jgi:hypothetical protein
MAKCPTEKCPEVLATHSRRKYCFKCRASMARYEKLEPHEVLDRIRARTISLFRIEHRRERRIDQHEALSQLRQSKRKAKR